MGKRIDKMPVHRVAALGISHIPQGRGLFPSLTVLENLTMGAHTRDNRKKIQEDLQSVIERFPILAERSKQKAGSLSGGEQQMLAIGRALMAKPKLFLLDEPTLGLAPSLVQEIQRTIQSICQEGVSMLLVEQNVRLALSAAMRGYIMQVGEIVLEGTSEDLAKDPMVQKAYLGG